jgi:hypothetical protein
MSKSNNMNIILIDKFGKSKQLQVNTKEFKKEDLYKKCGFKKDNDFSKQTEWKITVEKQKYKVTVYAKTDGRANTENKYDFPPPIDNTLFFGTCAVICEIKNTESGDYKLSNLSIELWEKIYEKLFGGFENLNDTAYDDENEEDELANIHSEKKTKQGYLKDGFVVDDTIDDIEEDDEDEEDDDDEDDEEDEEDENGEDNSGDDDEEGDDDDEDIPKNIEDEDDDDEDDDINNSDDDEIDNSDEENENVKKKTRKTKKNNKKKTGKQNNLKISIVTTSRKGKVNKKTNNDIIEELIIEDIASELSEEEYDYN